MALRPFFTRRNFNTGGLFSKTSNFVGKIMRLTGILLLTAALHVSATGISQKVTLSMENVPVQKVFAEVIRQTGISIVYSESIFEHFLPVSIRVKDASIQDVLSQCLRNQPFEYTMDGSMVVIKKINYATVSSIREPPPPVDIHGQVSDSLGVPLAGASVVVKGTRKGTSTDLNGNFTLTGVNNHVTLIISFTGYTDKIYHVDDQSEVKIFLRRSNDPLSQIQVIAYGTTTKRLNTGNVSTVTSETIAEQPVNNVLGALEGRVPGMIITQGSGAPGSGYTVQIRGQNSIANGNDPLYIVDGVPYPSTSIASLYNSSAIAGGNIFSTINPSDIESVNILKDADATAIYGSRGANGVVLITTKSGKAGKTKVDFNVNYGVGHIARTIDLMNTQEYLTMRNEAFKNDGATPSLSNGDYDLLLWDTTRYTDWQKLLIGNNSNIADANITVSGGSVNTQFTVGGGYHRETTVFPGEYVYRKGNGHFNLNHNTLDNKFKIDLSVTYGVEDNLEPLVDFTQQALSLAPDAPPVYDSVGKLNWPPGFDNPYSYLERKYEIKTNNLISRALLNYAILPGLQLRLSAGYNNIQSNSQAASPTTAFNPAYHVPSGNNMFSNASVETWILEPQIEFTKQVGPGKLDLLIGGTAEQDVKNSQSIYASEFSSDALIENIAAAGSTHVYDNTYTQYRYQAFFGRLNYNIGDKYIFNLTASRDGSSRFGPGKQFENFGALGAAWIFSREEFIQKILPFLSFGKLRSSYGITGNDQIGDYQYLSTYSPTDYPYQDHPGLLPTRLYNPNYEWETNKKFEIGMELGLMKDRLLFSMSYYNNHSSNQLIGQPLPLITGFYTIQQNLPAVVQNTGLEFTLSYILIKSKDFNWTFSGNLTIPRNKLVSFPNLEESYYKDIYEVGQPLTVWKSFQYLDVNPQAGIYEYVNQAGKPTLDPVYPDDIKAIKNIAPDYYGGIDNSFQYKGWKLDIFFQYMVQTGQNYFGQDYNAPGQMYNQPAALMNRWIKPGDHATFQKFTQAYDAAYNAYIYNTVYYGDNKFGDASFLRLKNVSLSYTFPEVTAAKWKMQNFRLYMQAQNLITITSYFGMDPENKTSFSLPPLRVITAGIQITL